MFAYHAVTQDMVPAFFGLHFILDSGASILIIIAVAWFWPISSMNVAFRSLNNPDLFSIVGWVFLLLITANLISTVYWNVAENVR